MEQLSVTCDHPTVHPHPQTYRRCVELRDCVHTRLTLLNFSRLSLSGTHACCTASESGLLQIVCSSFTQCMDAISSLVCLLDSGAIVLHQSGTVLCHPTSLRSPGRHLRDGVRPIVGPGSQLHIASGRTDSHVMMRPGYMSPIGVWQEG